MNGFTIALPKTQYIANADIGPESGISDLAE